MKGNGKLYRPIEPVYTVVGDKIRDRRKSLKLGLRDVAKASGVDFRYIFRVENANIRGSLSALRKIAKGLETTVSELLQGIG